MASVCNHCRLRRRRCDRIRPKCTSCINQGLVCVYGQPTDSQPSHLVQELISIREKLESIVPLLEPRLHSSAPHHKTPLVGHPQNCPALVIKSPHLMQILSLPKDLASMFYRLEIATPQISGSPVEPAHISSPDFILSRFQDQVHRWCPVLHLDFTHHFFESKVAGFPYSTKSCLSLLVASLANVDDYRPLSSHCEAALSMIPIVVQESSVTSVQCLVLFSIYYASILQPLQAYEYVQAAFLKLLPLLKSPYLAEGSPKLHLFTRLYWTMNLIESEISMHLNLSSMGRTLRGQFTKTPLPTSVDTWNYPSGSNSPSTSSVSDVPLSRYSPTELSQMFLHLSTEVNLQLVLNSYTSSVTDMPSSRDVSSPHVEDMAAPSNILNPLLTVASTREGPDFKHNQDRSQQMDDPICRVKSHMYEISLYWPVIYRVIMDGCADPELLPYGPLFFESFISFLCAARIALRICPPKAWFLCASIYIISIATVEALGVRSLRLLAPPRTWEYLEGSVDALDSPGELSPSVQYMRDSLKNRLELAKLQKSDFVFLR